MTFNLRLHAQRTRFSVHETQWLLSLSGKLWLSGKHREIVLFWGKPDARTDSDPGTVLRVLPEGRHHVLLILEAALHPARSPAPAPGARKGVCLLERRGWLDRVAAHVERRCIPAVVCVGAECRHEGGGGRAATVLDIQQGPLPDARQKGSVFQSSQMERLQKLFFFFLIEV